MLTIQQRLTVLVACLAAALVLVAGLGLRDTSRAVEGLRTVYLDRVVPLRDLKAIADAYAVSIVDLSHKTRNGNVRWDEAAASVASARKDIDRLWRAYLATELVAEEERIIAGLKPLMAEADRRTDELERILAARDQAALDRFTIEALYPAIDPVSEGFSRLVELQTVVAREVYEEAEQEYRRSRMIYVSAVAVLLLLSGAFSWRLIVGITLPLARATRHCAAIAEGDLGTEVVVDRNDEIGELLASLAAMQVQLRGIVTEVREGSVAIDHGAGEIAAGNLDLSHRTESQAANLEETASTMDQMTATVRQTADNAARGRQLFDAVRKHAERGGEVVAGAVQAMGEINASSVRIEQIIGVVDEIAFQTNLLALNAAVEAARAGDQGRGFAVVATEVRNLAQRSAQAAREIKDLIHDSVEKVGAGSRLVDESGVALAQLGHAFNEVSSIIEEMAASSREQSEGIAQVGSAIAEIDRITQQNAALVEEAAAAARSLEEQAHALTDRVAFFRTGEATFAGSSPRPGMPQAISPRDTRFLEAPDGEGEVF